MDKKVTMINPMSDGTCRTIKAQYYKTSVANFLLQTSRGASGVMVQYGETIKF